MDKHKTGLKRLYRLACLGIVMLALLYFADAMKEQWDSLPDSLISASAFEIFPLAIGIYLFACVLLGYAWHLLLRASGENDKALHVITIFLTTQIGKYIPGNFAHHIGRVALAREAGYDVPRVLFTMVMEIGWAVLAAVTLAIAILALRGPEFLSGSSYHPNIYHLVSAGFAFAVIPIAALAVFKRWQPTPLRKFVSHSSVQIPGPRTLLICFFLYFVNFLNLGLILDLIALRLFDAAGHNILALSCIFATAWIIGFVTPGAPGGLGVREAVLLAALSPIYGTAAAVGMAIILRIVTTCGDGAAFLVGVLLNKYLVRFKDNHR